MRTCIRPCAPTRAQLRMRTHSKQTESAKVTAEGADKVVARGEHEQILNCRFSLRRVLAHHTAFFTGYHEGRKQW